MTSFAPSNPAPYLAGGRGFRGVSTESILKSVTVNDHASGVTIIVTRSVDRTKWVARDQDGHPLGEGRTADGAVAKALDNLANAGIVEITPDA